MVINTRFLKLVLGLGVSLSLMFHLWITPVEASTSLLTSRINQLESNLRILSTQVSQLQSRIGREGRSTTAVTPPLASASTAGDPTLDAQFDNLAILVIELRDRIIELEAKVNELEA